ncbi:MAG: haloacid dehalogenase type II [Candidatus Solibacter sp.]
MDAFTTLDPRPITSRAEEVFPGKGALLADLWRTRQFEYTWLRTTSRTYVDFRQITEDSLAYTANALSLDLSIEKRHRLLRCFWEFKPWPDALAALQRLKTAGLRLVFLSNFTEVMLTSAVRSCGLQGLFEPHLSTDKVRAFKPDPRAYHMAVDALNLRRDEIVFGAFAGWDAAGAKAFGFPTFWVNRMKQPVEELGFRADAMGHDLDELARFVIGPETKGAL